MYNGLPDSNCETLREVLKADLHLHSRALMLDCSDPGWLPRIAALLRRAWRAVEGVDLRTTNNKLTTYQAFSAARVQVETLKLGAHTLNVETAS
eukprot:257354-Pelagomonas_calceolata.AAC.1